MLLPLDGMLVHDSLLSWVGGGGLIYKKDWGTWQKFSRELLKDTKAIF